MRRGKVGLEPMKSSTLCARNASWSERPQGPQTEAGVPGQRRHAEEAVAFHRWGVAGLLQERLAVEPRVHARGFPDDPAHLRSGAPQFQNLSLQVKKGAG